MTQSTFQIQNNNFINYTKQFVAKSKIRSQFLLALSAMFSKELKEYQQFVDIVTVSNREFIGKNQNKKVDSLERVIEERHGAIRVGTALEMRIVAGIFEAMGMEPVNFYDLTKVKKPLPIISTAFRPKTEKELQESAFRMFVSMLFVDDKRFFSDSQAKTAKEKLAQRKVFSDKLTEILNINKKQGGLNKQQADLLIAEAIKSFSMDKEQIIDFNDYKHFISNGNVVAADIICFKTIHINHLTPRVYDIFDVHKELQALGIPTIDEVQGPPYRKDQEVLPLLNQTSRKAPGEFVYAAIDTELLNSKNQSKIIKKLKRAGKISFIEPQILANNKEEDSKDYLSRVEKILKNKNTKLVAIKHKARFGEIECRGVALTPKGRAVYDQMIEDNSYVKRYPKTHFELAKKQYAYYKYSFSEKYNKLSKAGKSMIFAANNKNHDQFLLELVKDHYIQITPVTYEDFLPKSAAGIFESNLSTNIKISNKPVVAKEIKNQNQTILEKAMGKTIINSYELYADIENQTKKEIFIKLGIEAAD